MVQCIHEICHYRSVNRVKMSLAIVRFFRPPLRKGSPSVPNRNWDEMLASVHVSIE